ncbi:MAG TPA: uridine kinase [Planctomycetota bacterium]|nr:uridine kinase [Planctomycetota bacterium]
MSSVSRISAAIHAAYRQSAPRILLVGISGIDGAGKTFLAANAAETLRRECLAVALLGLDDWRTPPAERYNLANPGEHFYRNAYNTRGLFEKLIEPLRQSGSISVEAQLFRRDGSAYTHPFAFSNVNVIVLEGSFLFTRELQNRFDLRIWIDCSFETALKRALNRNQEGAPRGQLESDYETHYFPAQRFHMQADDPKSSAHLIISNDA